MVISKNKSNSNSVVNRLSGRPASSKSINSVISRDSIYSLDKKKNSNVKEKEKKNNVSFNSLNTSQKKNLRLNLKKDVSNTQINKNNISNQKDDFTKN